MDDERTAFIHHGNDAYNRPIRRVRARIEKILGTCKHLPAMEGAPKTSSAIAIVENLKKDADKPYPRPTWIAEGMVMEVDDDFQNLEQAACEILVRKCSATGEDVVKALAGFITCAEPEFFCERMHALQSHLERLLLIASDPLSQQAVARQVTELIVAARRRNVDHLISLDVN